MVDLVAKTFAGVRNTLPAERLKEDDLVEAVNVDLDNSGRPARRAGQELMVAGNIHSLWSDGQYCLYINSGTMYGLNPNFTRQAIATGLSTNPMAYLSINGRVYHSNGSITAVLDNGRIRSWGIDIGQTSLSAQATYGTMPAGIYQFAMTLLREDGQESGTGLAGRIELPDDSGLTFTWDTDLPAAITEVAIYLTQPNGETLHQALVASAAAGTAGYLGGSRSLPLATQWLDAPPAGQCLAHYRGRIYIASGANLFATPALGYEYCDLRDFIAVDGSRIVLLAAVENGLFVGTEQAIHFLAGAAFGELTPTLKMNAGAVAGSLVTANGMEVTGRVELSGVMVVLFTTTDGVVMGLPDGSLSNLTQERYTFSTTPGAAGLRHEATQTHYLLSMIAS